MLFGLNWKLFTTRATFAVVLFAMYGCVEQSKPFIVTIPLGFRGGIRLDVGKANEVLGDPDTSDARAIEITVPPDGIVKLRGKSPYSIWVETRAKFSNGAVIPKARSEPPGSPSLAPNIVKLWVEIDGWLFVGTDDEFAQWVVDPFPGNVIRN